MKHLIFVTAVLMLGGCGKKHDHGGHEGTTTKVELDNGKKWIADAPTNNGIAAFHAALKTFKADTPKPTLQDYHRLHGELQPMLDGIFKSCTMTGEGHRQLHNYLGSVVSGLMTLDGDDVQASADAVHTMDRHLAAYHDYFE